MEAMPALNPRQEMLLVFLSSEEREIDPIRIMKGLFLVTMETPEGWISEEARYQFTPYDYGPCSFEIYDDLAQLKRVGYVFSRRVLGRSWEYYSLTPEGSILARRLAESMDHKTVDFIHKVFRFVVKLSFRDLLSTIYKHYPKFAERSVFK